MASENLAALIQRLRPETSIRGLEIEARVEAGKIARYLKPGGSTHPLDVAPEEVEKLATALGCEPAEVMEAINLDRRVAYWLRPEVEGIPPTDIIREIARRRGCEPAVVVKEFMVKAGFTGWQGE